MKTMRWKLLLLIWIGVWARTGLVMAAPFPDDCEEVCTSSTACSDHCYPDEFSFINDQWITCYQWGVYEEPCCGDGSCDGGESAGSCFEDCHCGDEICNAGEDQYSCPSDCTGGGQGAECGDDECDGNETCTNCPEDCYSECVCGDSTCDSPAEGGGPHDDPCSYADLLSGHCAYCPQDCGECEFSDCDPQVCDEDGRCRACDVDIECEGQRWCDAGSCVSGDYCDVSTPCTQQGYSCNYSNHVCRPNVI